VDALKSLGATLVYSDLKDPASVRAACQDVTAVISTASACPSPHQPGDTIPAVDQAGQINLVDTARAAGVSHFVYISYTRCISTDSPLTTAKRAVEQHLGQSGLTYTILCPSYFMEVWLSPALGFDYPNAKAQIYGTGQNKISWISLSDVAQFAVESLRNPGACNATIELGGPEALSPLEVIQLFEQESGQPFAVQQVPEAALHAQKAQATDPLQQTFPALMIDYARGGSIDMRATLQMFPLHLTSVQDYIQHAITAKQP
jgi:uncharacterized protein YbjT (DUF2867 family)